MQITETYAHLNDQIYLALRVSTGWYSANIAFKGIVPLLERSLRRFTVRLSLF